MIKDPSEVVIGSIRPFQIVFAMDTEKSKIIDNVNTVAIINNRIDIILISVEINDTVIFITFKMRLFELYHCTSSSAWLWLSESS